MFASGRSTRCGHRSRGSVNPGVSLKSNDLYCRDEGQEKGARPGPVRTMQRASDSQSPPTINRHRRTRTDVFILVILTVADYGLRMAADISSGVRSRYGLGKNSTSISERSGRASRPSGSGKWGSKLAFSTTVLLGVTA